MTFLSIFRKDKKQKLSSLKSQSSRSTVSQDNQDNSASPESDYVLPPKASSLPALDNVPYSYNHSNTSLASAASKFKLPINFRRKSSVPSSPLVLPSNSSLSPPNTLRITDGDSRSSLLLPSSSSAKIASVVSQDSSIASISTQPVEDPKERRKSFEIIKKVLADSDKDAPGTPDSAKSGITLLGRVRERRKSKPTTPPVSVVESLPEPSYPKDSFNLKSFRHVGPEAPSIPPLGDGLISPLPSFSALPYNRSRENSNASETSQRMSVGAFRAQARRSSTNLSSSPVSPAIRALASPSPSPRLETPASRSTPTATAETPKPARILQGDTSSSDSDEDEDSDSDEGSPSRSRPVQRLNSQRTITPRGVRSRSETGHRNHREDTVNHNQQTSSARSENGHGLFSQVTASKFQKIASSSSNGNNLTNFPHRRAMSQSMSELGLPEAAEDANAIASAKITVGASEASQLRAKSPTSDTSGSDSSNSSIDSDNAPLALFANPPRTNSPMSMHSSNNGTVRSRTTKPAKPLVDLSMPFNPISGKPSPPDLPKFVERDPDQSREKALSPTNINSRLAQLTASLTSQDMSTDTNSSSSALSSPPVNQLRQASPEPKVQKVREEFPFPSAHISDVPKTDTIHKLGESSGDTSPNMGQRLAVHSNRSTNNGFKVVSRPKRMSTEPLIMAASPPLSPPYSNATVNLSSNEQIKPTPVRVRPPSSSFSVMSRPSTAFSDHSSSPPGSQLGSSINVSSPRPMIASSSTASSATLTSLNIATQVPQRPFANPRRQDSPASSTGGSSTGKLPLTPKDGSDYFNMDTSRTSDAASAHSGSSPSAMKGGRGQPKKASVTFEDKDDKLKARGRPTGSRGDDRSRANTLAHEQEARRRDRRREEAKKSIELGNAINGPRPIVDDGDDEDFPTANAMGPRMSMLNPMIAGSAVNSPPSIMGVDPWQYTQRAAPMIPTSPQFMMQPLGTPVPMSTDPNFLMAHQQAMMVARQAYQAAVAQQAMAVAGTDWDRRSNINGFTTGYPMGGGMGMPMGMGMSPSGWGGPMGLFPPPSPSMYGGSAYSGSDSPGGWGSTSVYGEQFGPATMDRRSQIISGGPMPFPRTESTNHLSDPAANRNGPRVRTKTAPSNTLLPPQHASNANKKRTVVPPSSWKPNS